MSVEIEAAPMCFACGQDNPVGLRIVFECDGDRCTAEFTPDANHVGWQETVHGGIIYAALDDVTANVLYKQGRKAHTARCEIRYRDVLRVGETVRLEGWIEKERGRLVQMKATAVRVADDRVIAECDASFMLADR